MAATRPPSDSRRGVQTFRALGDPLSRDGTLSGINGPGAMMPA